MVCVMAAAEVVKLTRVGRLDMSVGGGKRAGFGFGRRTNHPRSVSLLALTTPVPTAQMVLGFVGHDPQHPRPDHRRVGQLR